MPPASRRPEFGHWIGWIRTTHRRIYVTDLRPREPRSHLPADPGPRHLRCDPCTSNCSSCSALPPHAR